MPLKRSARESVMTSLRPVNRRWDVPAAPLVEDIYEMFPEPDPPHWAEIRMGVWAFLACMLGAAALIVAIGNLNLALGLVTLAGLSARRAVVNHRLAEPLNPTEDA